MTPEEPTFSEPPPTNGPWAHEFCEATLVGRHFQFEHIIPLSVEEQANIQDTVAQLVQAIFRRDLQGARTTLMNLFEHLRSHVMWPINTKVDTTNYSGAREYTILFQQFKKLFIDCFLELKSEILSTSDKPKIIPTCVANLGKKITHFIQEYLPEVVKSTNQTPPSPINIGPRVRRVWYRKGLIQDTGLQLDQGGQYVSLSLGVNGSDVLALTESVRNVVGSNLHVEAMERGRFITVAVIPKFAHDARKCLEKVLEEAH